MTWIWNGAVTIYRTLSRILLPRHFDGKVSSCSFGLRPAIMTNAQKKDEKDDYDPAYRSFVFYRILSPNEVSRRR
jgi:hypothetical protein